MDKLTLLTEQLASAVVMADPTDLPALAQVHEQLIEVGRLADELAAEDSLRADALRERASSAGQLLERIVLSDVDDSVAALRQVNSTVAELQQLINGTLSPEQLTSTPEPAAAPVSPAAEAPEPQAAATEPSTALNPDDIPLVVEFIGEALSHIESAEAGVLQLEENPEDLEVLAAIFRAFHTIKGVAGFLNLKEIGSLAHAAENLLDLARHGQIKLDASGIDVVLASIDIVKVMISALDTAVKQNAAPVPAAGLEALLHRLHAAASGTVAATDSPPARTTSASDASPAASARPSEAKASEGSSSRAGDATVKVATDRLDSLINMVGELVIAQSMVSMDMQAMGGQHQRIVRNMGQLGKITRELQDLSMSMRMVPIQAVFQKMARLVRDLARKAMKEVEFHVVGGETELDRNVVEAISDPLVHMVRNSVDHGIEPADERIAAGKPRAGRVDLKAYHHSGNIVIEITDDGRGLNKGKLLKKAIAAGIMREGDQPGDQEIFKLIFHAGLSTAEKITDVSGRGVGMDVVKRNVEALRGRIDIVSAEGKGSTFTIRLPLTLAVIDGQIIRVGSHRYIVPITSIEQSIQPKPEQLSTVQGRGEMCMVRGDLLPLFRLYRMFGVTPATEDPTKSLVVIVQDDHKRCCLMIDELLGQQQVVIKSLGEGLGHVPGISGGAILGDGNVSLILDIPGLIQMASAN